MLWLNSFLVWKLSNQFVSDYDNKSETKEKKFDWFENFQTKGKFEPQHIHLFSEWELLYWLGKSQIIVIPVYLAWQ